MARWHDSLSSVDHSAPCRRPVIQSGYTRFPPAYPLLHIDALNNELSKSSRTDGVDPVIYVPPGIGDFSGGSACCHVEMGELRLIASVSGDGEDLQYVHLSSHQNPCIVDDPLIAFAFLQAFSDILHDYFGTVSSATLKDNFDVVYQVGYRSVHRRPFWSNSNSSSKKRWILRGILSQHLQMRYVISSSLPPSSRSFWLRYQQLHHPARIVPEVCAERSPKPEFLLIHFVSCLPGSVASSAPSGAFASPIPWRKLGVRHNHNEILFDVTEEMRAMVGRRVTVMMMDQWT